MVGGRNKRRLLPQTAEEARPHPSRGGNAYDITTRNLVHGLDVGEAVNDPVYQNLSQHHIAPSRSTMYRWKAREANLGHVRPFVASGNRKSQILQGLDLYLLAFYRCLYSKAQAVEVIAFLWNSYGRFQNPPRLYDPSEITRAEQELGLTRKKVSTIARQALLPRNRIKRMLFWTQPYPFGISDISKDEMIDIDECAFFLTSADRKYGKAPMFQSMRVRKSGPYGHDDKWTLLMGISGRNGGIAGRNCWVNFARRAGTDDIDTFRDFIESMLQDIGPGTPGNRVCFTMDDLSSHKHPTVLHAIVQAGHRFMFRAPYYPVDGPLKYVFEIIETTLKQNLHKIYTHQDLFHGVIGIINNINEFDSYFTNVGFN